MFFTVGLASLMVSCVSGWVNKWDEKFNFTCPTGETISRIVSTHDNFYEDRIWDFSCQSVVNVTNACNRTDWLNRLDEMLVFECKGDQALVGVESLHQNYYEDRLFRFICCKVYGLDHSSCYISVYINNWDGYMNKQLGENEVIKGLYSYHSNYYEDRRWKLKICDVNSKR